MKYIGALIFAVCASVGGFYKSRELKRRAESSKEIALLARGIASYIEKLKLPLCDIYRRLSPSNKLAKSLAEGEVCEINADEELKAKLDFFLENIGGGFTEEEITLCNELEEFALQKQSVYDKEYQSKAVLYRSLGLIAGLAAMIVIA